MAKMIGEGATPAQINYTFGDDAWRLASSNIDAIRQLTGTITKEFKDHKEKKDAVKVGADKIDAVAKLFGDESGAFAGIAAQLKDEEIPLSQRAGLAREIDSIASLATDKFKLDMQQSQFDREMTANDWEASQAADQQALQNQTTALVAPAVIRLLEQSVAALGPDSPVTAEQVKALQGADPRAALPAALQLASVLPQEEQDKIMELMSQDASGRPTKGTYMVNPRTGSARPVMIEPTGFEASLPGPLRQFAGDFQRAGEKYGVDPRVLAGIAMHETAGGTSSAFKNKNNAMGISDSKGPISMPSVAASIDKMASLLGATDRGPYANAETIAEVAGIYAPPGATNDPRGLNRHWTDGVSRNVAALGGDPSAPIRAIPAVAPDGASVDEERRALELEELRGKIAKQKIAAEAATAKNEEKTAEVASAAGEKLRTLKKIERYIDDNGKPTKALSSAVGWGEETATSIRKWTGAPLQSDETLANQKELALLQEQDLLKVAASLKPVSEDEMKQLMARRPEINSPPAVWARYLGEMRDIILRDAMMPAQEDTQAMDRDILLNGQ